MDKTQTFSDLPGADPSVWCHVCGMPRSAVDPLVTRGNDLLCHMCAYESVVGELARLRAELEQTRAELEETDKLRLQAQQSRDTWQANYYKMREAMKVISGISSNPETPTESMSLVHKIASDALK